MTDTNGLDRPRADRFFTSFSTWVAKWTGSHWALSVASVFVVASLAFTSVEVTNIAISTVTLLMVFVLQNTQNRDSAALHVKLDEIVRVAPEARNEVRGVESKSHDEIRELHREDSDLVGKVHADEEGTS